MHNRQIFGALLEVCTLKLNHFRWYRFRMQLSLDFPRMTVIFGKNFLQVIVIWCLDLRAISESIGEAVEVVRRGKESVEFQET